MARMARILGGVLLILLGAWGAVVPFVGRTSATPSPSTRRGRTRPAGSGWRSCREPLPCSSR